MDAGEVAEFQELAAFMVPGDPGPVVETLQREMDVFVGLEFDDHETVGSSAGKDVNHGAVGSRESRHLAVNTGWIETVIEHVDVGGNNGFQPALGHHLPERMLLGTVGMTNFAQMGGEITESGFTAGIEETQFAAENDFLLGTKRCVVGREAGVRESQAPPAERDLADGKNFNFTVWGHSLNLRDGGRESLENNGMIEGMAKPGPHVAAVGAIELGERIVRFIELIQGPFSGTAAQSSHTFNECRRAACRHNEIQPLHDRFGGLRPAALIQPENAEGERGVNGTLRFQFIHAEHGKSRTPVAHEAASVNRAEGFFQIGSRGHVNDGEIGPVAFQTAPQLVLVSHARRTL